MLDDTFRALGEESAALCKLFLQIRNDARRAAEKSRQFNAEARQRLSEAQAVLRQTRLLARNGWDGSRSGFRENARSGIGE